LKRKMAGVVSEGKKKKGSRYDRGGIPSIISPKSANETKRKPNSFFLPRLENHKRGIREVQPNSGNCGREEGEKKVTAYNVLGVFDEGKEKKGPTGSRRGRKREEGGFKRGGEWEWIMS